MEPPILHMMSGDVNRRTTDLAQLKTLRICQYVWAGLSACCSSVCIIYIMVGIVFLNNPQAFDTPGTQPAAGPDSRTIGWVIIGMSSTVLLLGWTMGVLNLIAARAMAKPRWRTFSLVIAGVNCVMIPLGLILGIFTFIVLLRPSVRELYAEHAAAGPLPPGA